MKIVEKGQDEILTMLSDFDRKLVCVYYSALGIQRNQFCTQICIQGTLQKHSEQDQFRVLIDDNNYTYFSSKDVISIINNPEKGRPNIAIQAVTD